MDLDERVERARARLRGEADGMVLAFDRHGDLIYASAVKRLSQALEEVAEVYELRGAEVVVERCATRPWSAVPFEMNILSLWSSAEA